MKVILLEDIHPLGKAGEKVTVKDGYGRNFLLMQGRAVSAGRGTGRQAQALQTARLRSLQRQKQKAQELSQRLSRLSCEISVSVGEQGKLHGSVTSADIAQALSAQGIVVEKQQIELDRPLTQLGPVEVPIRLHPEVKAAVRVSIVPR